MAQGIKRSRNSFRHLALFALAFALPASSMTSDAAVERPAPSVAQRALIDIHDTAGVGWWSSSALEMGAAPAAIGATGGYAGPLAPAPGGVRGIRMPAVEND